MANGDSLTMLKFTRFTALLQEHYLVKESHDYRRLFLLHPFQLFQNYYGQVINPLDSTDTSNFIRSLSQEHGIVGCTNDFFNRISIGDIIDIYPIHSCLTANLMKAYVTETGEKISHFGSGAPFTG